MGSRWRRRAASVAAVLACVGAVSAPAPASAAAVEFTPAEIVNAYNWFRVQNGFPGGVALDQTWSAGCEKHNNWMSLNRTLAHPEVVGSPGYTTEGHAAGTSSVLARDWYDWHRSNPWINAPIHLAQMLIPRMAFVGASDSHGYNCLTTWPGAYQSPAPPTGEVFVYPRDGGFARYTQTAQESPFVPQELGANPIPAGQATGPNIIVFYDGPGSPGNMNLSTATLSGPNGAVAIKIVTPSDGGGYVPGSSAFIIPRAPLDAGMTYTLSGSFTGTAPTHEFTSSFTATAHDPTAPTVRGSEVYGDPHTCVAPAHWTDSVITYQWLRTSGPIPGATDPEYTPTLGDSPEDFSCKVTAFRGTTSISAYVRSFYLQGNLYNDIRPSISGTPRAGSVLTCNPGTWTTTPASYTYSWHIVRDGKSFATSGPTYTVLPGDRYLNCSVWARSPSGQDTGSSPEVWMVVDPPATIPRPQAPTSTSDRDRDGIDDSNDCAPDSPSRPATGGLPLDHNCNGVLDAAEPKTLRGSSDADILSGGDAADTIRGAGGADRLYGATGNDRIFGEFGSDKLFGGSGNDLLDGGPGNDLLDGGTGSDVIVAGPGKDIVQGRAGKDQINVRDGVRDIVYCGEGVDTVKVDRYDRLLGCERVRRN